jgi:hypothetical protein
LLGRVIENGGGVFEREDEITKSTGVFFMLGTPNSDSMKATWDLLCFGYLQPAPMQNVFNRQFLSFGDLPLSAVYAFAGTKECITKERLGLALPWHNGNSDGVVTTSSVLNISYECKKCGLTLPGTEVYYTQEELGSGESISILRDRIIPNLSAARMTVADF